jgi:hypothetical protein
VKTVAGTPNSRNHSGARAPLTKKIHASRSAAADLIHELACGYARGSDAGLAVTGPGFPAWPAARQRRRLARADII